MASNCEKETYRKVNNNNRRILESPKNFTNNLKETEEDQDRRMNISSKEIAESRGITYIRRLKGFPSKGTDIFRPFLGRCSRVLPKVSCCIPLPANNLQMLYSLFQLKNRPQR
uniref:Uncharacterized protein n=1 Tax=Cacopsylla melanoneura TaxID=428564 RepID=A0A8D8PLD1_9HEMI